MATTTMQLKIDERTLSNIKKIARFKSVEENKDISWQDLIREVIYDRYSPDMETIEYELIEKKKKGN